jgi:protein-S-isoprenylcysteine O-methyltransferase Ste14
MSGKRRLLIPAVWAFYLVIVLEFLFMISPLALHFYASYGPILNLLHKTPWTAWLTGFFLPHFSTTTSPLLNALKPLGFLLALVGLLLFLMGAIQVYGSKLFRRGAVTGGLYLFVRHPQYLALAILGLGVTLIWPRFFVLLSYLVMLALYGVLARWEEARCVEKYGESYRAYQRRTGRFIPRLISETLPGRREPGGDDTMGRTLLRFGVIAVVAIAVGFALREYTLLRITARYTDRVVILSPALLSDAELEAAYRLAADDPRTRQLLTSRWPAAPLLAYVVPGEWYLPDLPLHSEEEIRRERGGHGTPGDFNRTRYKVLFTRARTHLTDAKGKDVVRWAYGRDPVTIVWVDLEAGEVLRHEEPPRYVIWGDIPTPLF